MVSAVAISVMPLAVGVLFVISFFFSDKNELFRFLAYFPRKRERSVKAGSLVFGVALIIVGLFNLVTKVFGG